MERKRRHQMQTDTRLNERCTAFVGVAVTPTQDRDFRLAANSAAGGNKSAWIKRTLAREAQRVLRRKIK